MATDIDNSNNARGDEKTAGHPFRKAVVRGLTVLLPPLFTILILIWVLNMTNTYMLAPVTDGVRWVLLQLEGDIREEEDLPAPDIREEEDLPAAERDKANPIVDGQVFQKLEDNKFVPQRVYDRVQKNPGDDQPKTAEQFYDRYVDLNWEKLEDGKFIPQDVYDEVQNDVRTTGSEPPKTAEDFYRRWIDLTMLQWYKRIPFFLALLVLVLYLLGKFMAARIGRYFWGFFERGIHRLPVVRIVYSSVKQVSDFLFTERELEYTRVVAVEYPRKGIFSLGFVTGQSMVDIRAAADEPVLSVLMPTSPMPLTGFTVTVRKSETVDLDITIDQAFQFIVSCGVVVPPQQLQQMQSSPDALPATERSDESDGSDSG